MQDITSTNLEAAIIDQKVAGAFRGKAYAFVAVTTEDGYQLGVAVEDEPGYSPIDGKTFSEHAEAKQWASGLNRHIGLSPERTVAIVMTTMRRPLRSRYGT
jgi:hypothetical protein